MGCQKVGRPITWSDLDSGIFFSQQTANVMGVDLINIPEKSQNKTPSDNEQRHIYTVGSPVLFACQKYTSKYTLV